MNEINEAIEILMSKKEAKGSKYRGVYRCGNDKWKAQIQIDGVSHYLGVFEDEIAAATEYNSFAISHGRPDIINKIDLEREFNNNDLDSLSLSSSTINNITNVNMSSNSSVNNEMIVQLTSDNASLFSILIKIGKLTRQIDYGYRYLCNCNKKYISVKNQNDIVLIHNALSNWLKERNDLCSYINNLSIDRIIVLKSLMS